MRTFATLLALASFALVVVGALLLADYRDALPAQLVVIGSGGLVLSLVLAVTSWPARRL